MLTDDRSRRYHLSQVFIYAAVDVPLQIRAGGYTCDIRQLSNQHLGRFDLWISSGIFQIG
jgi:hypothetical protein